MRGVRGVLAAVLCGLAAACYDAGGPPPAEPVAAADEAPRAMASVATGAGLEVSVVGVRRASPDIVQVDLVAENAGQGVIDVAAALDGRDGGLSKAFLVAEEGSARVFVLVDDEGAPQCSATPGPLEPGAQRPLFVRFAALSPEAHRVTLALPGLPPLGHLEVPGPGL